MTLKSDAKVGEKLICCFKNVESLKNLNFCWFLLCKVYNILAKKIQRSYILWHWKVMQNLNKNWITVWKMTGGIWQIFTGVLESFKIGTLMISFYPKQKMYELKIYRWVICHDNEEWCKIWRGNDLLFQNWHQEIDKLWPESLKVSNIFALMGSFSAKHILFDLKKKYRGVIFHDANKWFKIWRKTDLWFERWWKEFGKFLPEQSKVSKLGLWWDPFIRSRKCMSLKFTEELCVMTMKNYAKFGEELTCHFKIDMRDLTNFDWPQHSKVPQIFTLMGSF